MAAPSRKLKTSPLRQEPSQLKHATSPATPPAHIVLRLTQSSSGAFGSNNNAGSSLFGSKPATGGFGSSTNTGGGLFGNTSNSNNTPSFGGSGGAFGSAGTAGTGSGAAPAFGGGTSSGGAFGGFGANNNNNNNATSAFGSSQNKPLFGAGGSGTTGAFGGSNNAFGSGTALGQNAVPPAEGTNGPAFTPWSEKEPNGTTVNYQTITFMQPYQKYSLEELRLADYQHGRQYGNGQGGTGAFGQSNFGGTSTGGAFGSGTTSGGLFGSTATSGGAFGSNTATSGGFGSSTGSGGGLFGSQNKTGGLFGAQQASAPASGGLFGASSNTGTTGAFGGFGSNNTTSQPSGGLFGNAQNKPAGGLFGNTSTTTPSTGFSFGQQNNNQQSETTSGGLFGTANNTQQGNTGGGLFGNAGSSSNNNQQSSGLFGNKTGGAFNTSGGQNQSGGLFGSTNNTSTGGGLFGQNNNQQSNTASGLFGPSNNNSNQSGGLFGNTQSKPAGGLFGNTSTNTGGGLFNTSTNNNQGGGLFGNANNNQQQPSGGLFGNTQSKPAGGLFGNASTNTGGGLFGNNSTNNQQQSSGLFSNSMNSGLFGASQSNQQQQNPNQQEVKHASLLDPNPYGQSSIWTGLPAPTDQNSKPVFTPLTATKKLEESKMKPLPSLRLNQSRYNTPPRRPGGYGLSYSTYGTPNSATSTPGGGPLSGSMYGSRGWSGGSFGRSFNRSASVQNLRSQYASDSDDIWKPNAFAPSHRNSSGSIKRLTIDRSIRQDLFNRPATVPALPAPKPVANGDNPTPPAQQADGNTEPARKLSKRVSFDNKVQETTLNGDSGALQRIEDSDDATSSSTRNGNSNSSLQAVPEDRESHQVSQKSVEANATADPVPSEYWMRPSRQEMSKMPRDQLKSFKNFQVGREGLGFVNFDGAVDLTALDLDALYEQIVEIRVRCITVYPDPATKPPVGRGLNVPSTLTIENSWPRSKGKPVRATQGPVFDRHIQRLKTRDGTELIDYDAETGKWTFKVLHYTRYGLDYDEDEDSMMDQSELSLPPQSIDKSADVSVMEVDDQSESNDEDDTFAFRKSVPGQFGNKSVIPTEEDTQLQGDPAEEQLDDGSERSAYSEDDLMSEDEQSPPMPGSLPTNPFLPSPQKSPTKATVSGTPGKPLLDLDGDWAEQLQRTISPRKQNREVLREAQSKMLLDKAFSPIKPKAASQVNFRSSIDIMNSMFKPSKKANKVTDPDFEV